MKPFKTLYAAVVLAVAAAGPVAAHTDTRPTVLDEGFDEVANLAGWYQVNRSVPQGNDWFQGNAGIFGAYQGDADSYVGNNFLSALGGSGSVDHWLVTPTLSVFGYTTLSFYTRSSATPGFNDTIEMLFAPGSGSGTDGFMLLNSVGRNSAYPDEWTRISTSFNATGPGRFAFRYVGSADTLDYIGIDSVRVVSAVPEPSSWLMLGLGIAAVGAARRKLSK